MATPQLGIFDRPESLSDGDFLFFKEKIFERAGIHLGDQKKDLVATRLGSLLKRDGRGSYGDYRRLLSTIPAGDPEWQKFVNTLTTNKTDFFREPRHFAYLTEKLIPRWEQASLKQIKVWCCASSTGEEPFTLSMVLGRHLPSSLPYHVLATDIDTQVLARAQNGVYSVGKLHEIPADYHANSLHRGKAKAEGWFKINDAVHRRVQFQYHNLIETPSPGEGAFDLILCRNVMIYFAPATIRTLMEKLHRSLKPGGVLMIGHSESIAGCAHLFQTIQPAVYRKCER